MSKAELYDLAKNLARELGFDEAPLRRLWRGSTRDFWRGRVETYRRDIRNRAGNRERALELSRRYNEPLQRPERIQGSSNEEWVKEIRRIRMIERRRRVRTKNVISIQAKAIAKRQKEVEKTRVKDIIENQARNIIRRQGEAQINGLIRKNQFQTVLNIIVRGERTLTPNQATLLYNQIVANGRYTITYDINGVESVRPVNNTTRETLLQLWNLGHLVRDDDQLFGSDTIAEVFVGHINSMRIRAIVPARVIANRDGRFFPHINTTKINLLDYQIFTQEEAYNKKIVVKREHCLLHTLLKAGISKTIVNQIKMSYFGREIGDVNIRKKDLHKIADTICRDITINTMNGARIAKQRIISTTKPDLDDKPPIEIAMYENHYFIFKDTDYSKYSINNYEVLKDIKDFHKITKIRNKDGKLTFERSDNFKINSLLLVDKLFKANLFKKLDLTKFEEASAHKDLKDHIFLDNIENEQRLCGSKGKTVLTAKQQNKNKKKKVLTAKQQNALIRFKQEEPVDLSEKEEAEYDKFIANCEAKKEDSKGKVSLDMKANPLFQGFECEISQDKYNKILDKKFECETEKPKPDIWYADSETYTKNVDSHELQLLGYTNDTDDFTHINNVNDPVFGASPQQMVYEFLKVITKNGTKNVLCYFHNVKYDYFILEKYLTVKSRCEKGGQIYNVVCRYKNVEVEFRDSFKIIPFALAKFGKEFNLPEEIRKKEAISYEYYTRENNDQRIPTSEYKKLLCNKDKVIFEDVVKKCTSYDATDKTFNPMTYYKEYLRLDCLVLKKGIQKFDGLIKEITEGKMSVYESLTISSLTDKYMKLKGAYDGVYEVKGNLRAYIAKAVYGGRVCVNEKYLKEVIKGKFADYDGVSLYPSAINRLCRTSGLSLGKAKRLTSDLFGNWEKYHYAVITVKITKVNKKQQMPFVAYKNDSSIKYLNTPPPKPVVIDSTTLQDYIKFQKIEYEILEGVYWDEGGSDKMGKVIKHLFDARLKYKQTNKALANTIKLMLNSSYGKTIMKKTTTEKLIINTSSKTYDKKNKKWVDKKATNLESYVYNNFHTIKSYRKLNDTVYEVQRTCADDSYNRGHIGCAILSTSKRIMNEVFDIANTEKFPIYYTDTDSLHCNHDDVVKLNLSYWLEYKKELTGIQLEQFHTDFNMLTGKEGDLDRKERQGKGEEIYSTTLIPLGKKSYMDCLESKDKDGNIITGTHIRLKGITTEGILAESKKYEEGSLGLFKELAKGTAIVMTLNPFNKEENKQKVLFDFKNGRVSTRTPFTRKVKF